MISKKELSCIESIIETEYDSLKVLEKLLASVNEPQLRSEFQNVISSHRNHITKLIKVLEKCNEK